MLTGVLLLWLICGVLSAHQFSLAIEPSRAHLLIYAASLPVALALGPIGLGCTMWAIHQNYGKLWLGPLDATPRPQLEAGDGDLAEAQEEVERFMRDEL